MTDKERIAQLHEALAIADKNLDDIDAAGDMFKPAQTPYFKYVAAKCRENMRVWRTALGNLE
jgi:hypothetical protein